MPVLLHSAYAHLRSRRVKDMTWIVSREVGGGGGEGGGGHERTRCGVVSKACGERGMYERESERVCVCERERELLACNPLLERRKLIPIPHHVCGWWSGRVGVESSWKCHFLSQRAKETDRFVSGVFRCKAQHIQEGIGVGRWVGGWEWVRAGVRVGGCGCVWVCVCVVGVEVKEVVGVEVEEVVGVEGEEVGGVEGEGGREGGDENQCRRQQHPPTPPPPVMA